MGFIPNIPEEYIKKAADWVNKLTADGKLYKRPAFGASIELGRAIYTGKLTTYSEAIKYAEDTWKGNLNAYKLHWYGGNTEIIYGIDEVSAFNDAGIGRGALRALDYWEKLA
jgi:hypothetical protein